MNVNARPGFEVLYVWFEVEENAAVLMNVGDPVLAADPELAELTYSLVGAAAGLFDLDSSTGLISIGAATELDHESPADSNGDNVYEVTITPAQVTALIVADRTPEQRQASVRPEDVMLNIPGEWPADRPLPEAYIVTTLGDMPDTSLARFHVNWEAEPDVWRLTVENLHGVDDFEEVIEVIGLWEFHFEVP